VEELSWVLRCDANAESNARQWTARPYWKRQRGSQVESEPFQEAGWLFDPGPNTSTLSGCAPGKGAEDSAGRRGRQLKGPRSRRRFFMSRLCAYAMREIRGYPTCTKLADLKILRPETLAFGMENGTFQSEGL